MESTDGTDFADIPTRPMRVKILYTFDVEAKTTCLARLPHTLNIPAVAIDEQSQVGVIELQQCIQAIVTASPEIMSVLENGDFSVYTYDYSEYDAPVVGQGRISSLLALPTPAGQDNNKTMITGRVCKNIALFNNGVKETLEVKFKLTPLSRPSHSELAKNVDALRSMSPATSAGFDPNAWNASKPQQVAGDFFDFDMSSMDGGNGAASLEAMFGLDSGGGAESQAHRQQPGGVGPQETPSDSAFAYNPACSNQSHSAPGSRAGSPMMGPSCSSRNGIIRHQSFAGNVSDLPEQNRPASRASVRSESFQNHPQQQPLLQQDFEQQRQTKQQTDVFYNEDGQPRKRAKVVQAEWHGKSSFGSRSSDLRVTAATTSSMNMFRPIAKRPAAPGSDLEPPPRVPTPVAKRTRAPNQRISSIAPRSSLRQASVAESDFMSDIEPHSDAMSSPEGYSPENSMNGEPTPMDIPSSPPIVPGYNLPTPSSPGLPTLPPPRLADSGYMSERGFQSSTIMESMEDESNRSPDADDMALAARYRPRKRQQGSFVKTEGSPIDDAQSISAAPEMTPHESFSTSRRGSLALPTKPAQSQPAKAPAKQKRRPLHRSQTANESEAGSPAPSDTESRPRAGRSGSSAPRQVIIQRRLEESIAKGEMPQFCSHCGAIETPTWRKLYVKSLDGAPETLDSVEGEGETIGIEIQERDDEGQSTKYLIRKSMKKTKDFQPGPGFKQTTVCNPCGLWFNKFRNMRPADKWHRKAMSRKSKKRSNDDNATDGLEPPSEAFFTDQVVPDEAVEEATTAETQPGTNANESAPQAAAYLRRPRANSMQEQHQNVRRPQRDPAYLRAIQSSPGRPQGSQDSPIEVDLTPNPTRRLLFPSPRRDGEDKNLDGGIDVSRPRSAPTADEVSAKKATGKVLSTPEQMDVSIFEVFTHEKENRPPLDTDDDLAHLFEGSPGSVFKTPARKTPAKPLSTPRSQKSYGELMKTPTPSSRKRKALTPSAGNAANNAEMNANDFMTSPSSARYFLRSTPSRLERTPGGRTGSRNPSNEVSPFSRHLAQMLSDANGMEGAPFTSPSRQFDFSDLPTFTTPGREVDWKGLDDILSSEFASYDDGNGMAFSADMTGGGA